MKNWSTGEKVIFGIVVVLIIIAIAYHLGWIGNKKIFRVGGISGGEFSAGTSPSSGTVVVGSSTPTTTVVVGGVAPTPTLYDVNGNAIFSNQNIRAATCPQECLFPYDGNRDGIQDVGPNGQKLYYCGGKCSGFRPGF